MRVIGLFIDWVSFSYHQQVWGGVQAFCEEKGVNLITLVIGRADSKQRWEQMRGQLLDFVDGQNFDGFILLTATLGLQIENFYALLDKVAPAPVVSVADDLPGIPSVLVDNTLGFRDLLQHLVDTHGYRRFAYAGGPTDNPDAQKRKEVFLRFIEDNGLVAKSEHILAGDFNTAWGAEAVGILIPEARPEFDVLVCANDEICAGAFKALAQKNLYAPHDLALTGYDDTPDAAVANISTVRQPLSSLGWTAAAQLLNLIEGKEVVASLCLGSQSVIRQSCGCPSSAQRIGSLPCKAPLPTPLNALLAQAPFALVDDMVQEGLDRQLGQRVIAQLQGVLQTGDIAQALRGMRHVYQNLAEQGQLPSVLNFPLTVLRRWCLAASDYPAAKALIESTFHQLLMQLGDELHMQSTRHTFDKDFVNAVLLDLNVRLIYADNFSEQASTLLALLPKLGIHNFQVILYDNPEDPMAGARTVLTSRGEERGGATELQDPRTLLRPQHSDDSEPWVYIVEALYDQKTSLGFFRLQYEGDDSLLSCIDQLCETVGRGIGTLRRIQNLESQVTRRTDQLQSALADLEQRNKTLNAVALSDQLTGLYNRRGFLSLAEEHFQSQPVPHPVILFFADLDGLKRINDTWGHEVGDEAIRLTARLLTETFRAEDIVARLGGDEFVILAPGCTPSVADNLAVRLATSFAQIEAGRYGISMGWVDIDMAANLPVSHWMKEADAALYREKQGKKQSR
ncbi:MAG: GGDEF domain-containing protein [Rhodoferax sp.]|nr:GGDEF domain-containing protein [Rhodoferax sp.]